MFWENSKLFLYTNVYQEIGWLVDWFLNVLVTDLLTYCRVASHFIVWDASAAFSILAESSLHCSLSLARSVILTRSSVDWSQLLGYIADGP